MITNEEARTYFTDKGLSYSVITEGMIARLQELLTEELEIYKTSDNHAKEMNIHLRKPLKKKIKILKSTGLQFAFLRVDGSCFHDREAISFNKKEEGFMEQTELDLGVPVDESKLDHNPMVNVYGYGPEDKRCKHCKHLFARRYSGTYYKCDLRQNTKSASTDHRVNWRACSKFDNV